MPNTTPLPEAVRGCWYHLPQSFELSAGKPDSHQILSFCVDGTFTRYQVEGDKRTENETGEYTFDGNFLIIRARKTNTYRVHRSAFWHWELEGKKNSYTLLRGFVDSQTREPLPDEERRDIGLLPRRARVEADFDGDDVIYRLIYERGAQDRRLLATFSVEDGEHTVWIGLTPLVDSIEPSTWEKIIRKSYLGMFRDDSVDAATLHLFDSDQSRSLAD